MARRLRSSSDADVSEVEQFAHGLSMNYLQCRELGHNWRPHTARWVQDQGCYERVLRCVRCQTLRIQLLDQYGAIISSSYKHAEGYLHKGMGRIVGESRDIVRLESLTRFLSSATNKAS